jgi:hypothetical protein
MELPEPVKQCTYDSIVEKISSASEKVCEESMGRAAREEEAATDPGANGLTVSGDGTWRKRGFASRYGVATIIGTKTGKVIDRSVKSSYCQECVCWENKTDTAEYEEWYEEHIFTCAANYTGSAGGMEVESIVEMFQQSVTKHGVKYANYVGDGDSKTYKSVVDAKPYPDLIVCKLECVGHVQKRLGKNLRDWK